MTVVKRFTSNPIAFAQGEAFHEGRHQKLAHAGRTGEGQARHIILEAGTSRAFAQDPAAIHGKFTIDGVDAVVFAIKSKESAAQLNRTIP